MPNSPSCSTSPTTSSTWTRCSSGPSPDPPKRRGSRGLFACLDLAAGDGEELVHLAAHLAFGDLDARAFEVAADAAQHIFVAGGGDAGADDGGGVVVEAGLIEAHQLAGPQPQEPVAAGRRLELQRLVLDEVAFEAFFTLVEGGHARS